MQIINEYTPNAHQLAHAGSLYFEKLPLMIVIITFMNMFAIVLALLLLVKFLFTWQFTWQEILATMFLLFWIFGRKKANLKLLERRINQSPMMASPIHIDINYNGVRWSGKKLRPDSIAWKDIKWIIQCKNGYIIPNRLTRFLWVPNSGFAERTGAKDLLALIQEKRVPLRVYEKYAC